MTRTTKKIETLEIGDTLDTMAGPRRVTRVLVGASLVTVTSLPSGRAGSSAVEKWAPGTDMRVLVA